MIKKACVLYRNLKKRDMKQWTFFLLFGHFQRKEAEGEKRGNGILTVKLFKGFYWLNIFQQRTHKEQVGERKESVTSDFILQAHLALSGTITKRRSVGWQNLTALPATPFCGSPTKRPACCLITRHLLDCVVNVSDLVWWGNRIHCAPSSSFPKKI